MSNGIDMLSAVIRSSAVLHSAVLLRSRWVGGIDIRYDVIRSFAPVIAAL